MNIEELTEENIKLKNELSDLTNKYSNSEKQNKEYENLIVELRGKNAQLYSMIGNNTSDDEIDTTPIKKQDFINDYIKEKIEKGV